MVTLTRPLKNHRGVVAQVYHRFLWYDATILKTRPAAPTATSKTPQFEAFVHFENWSKRHDNWCVFSMHLRADHLQEVDPDQRVRDSLRLQNKN